MSSLVEKSDIKPIKRKPYRYEVSRKHLMLTANLTFVDKPVGESVGWRVIDVKL